MKPLTFRELDPAEFSQIPSEATGGYQLPASNCKVVAGIDESGKIAACWAAVAVVHLEPLWVREDYRKSGYVIRRLWTLLKDVLLKQGVRTTLTVIADAVPVTRKVASWCGAREVPGKLFFLDISSEGGK